MAVSVVPAIPASHTVNVIPSVLSAGGNALDLIGLILTQNARPPIGQVLSFANADDVGAYFGSTAQEAALATIYFLGPDNATAQPGALLFAQYPESAVAAYLRSGNISGMALTTLQALNGTMTVVFDGTTHAGSINLAAATSFSNAATIIQTAVDAAVSVTGSIAANVVTGTINPNVVTGSVAGTVLTVTAVTTGLLATGQTISGTSVVVGTTILAQLTGTAGSTGTYTVTPSQAVASTAITASGGGLTVTAVTTGRIAVGATLSGTGVTASTTVTAGGTGTGGTGTYPVNFSQTVASTTITANGGTLTVTAVATGVLAVNDVIAGVNVTLGTKITALVTGAGGTGTYMVDTAQTAASATITVSGAGVTVVYDSVLGAFVMTSGTTGVTSTSAYATGAIATSLLFTAATGAVLSQGTAAAVPATFMDSITALTRDWVSFMTTWEASTSEKEAFATWTDGKGNRYVYEMWTTNVANTMAGGPSASVAFVTAGNLSGTSMIYEDPAVDTVGGELAAFEMSWTACLDFTRKNGKQTAKFKRQAGLAPQIFSETVADYLESYGLNYYGDETTANQAFTFYEPGTISGPFRWKDSYVNQIWLNNQLQLAIMVGLTSTPSVPYNLVGAAQIRSFCMDPIKQGVNFGAIVAGTLLSAAQKAAVNNAAGFQIDDVIFQQGWYLLIGQAIAQVRAARTSPPCTLFYGDGGAVHKITLASIEIQ